MTLEPDGTATGCNPVQVGSTPTGVSLKWIIKMKTDLLRDFIETRRLPLMASIEVSARLHRMCAAAPEFCVRALADQRTHVSQKAELLAVLLRMPIDRNLIAEKLFALTDNDLLFVLDGLRLRRINGRKARELGLKLIVGHSRIAEMAANHRLRLVKILKHLLGERTWSSVCRYLRDSPPESNRFLQSKLLRFATDLEQACEAICFLAGIGFDRPSEPNTIRGVFKSLITPWSKKTGPKNFVYINGDLRQSVMARVDLNRGRGMPRQTLSGIKGTFHKDANRKELRNLAAPSLRRLSLDGMVTAAIKTSFKSAVSVSLDEIVGQVEGDSFPSSEIRTAVVLDLSGSMISSGERLYHPASLGLAIVGLLQRYVGEMMVFQVGGSVVLNGQRLPYPQGATDLASAVLEAARSDPNSILIVSDGFENYRQGDVSQVVVGLKKLGMTTRVEQVTPVIAEAEDLSQRRLSNLVPVVPVEHETAVGELAARILLAAQPKIADEQLVSTVEKLLFQSE